MLEKLLESVDENVLTPELKQSLEESFNEAVETKSQEIADQIVSEKINALNEHCDDFKAQLNEEVEQMKSDLQAQKVALDEEYQNKCAEIQQNVSNYMDHVVEELVNEHSEKLEECVKDSKCEALDEMFGTMLKVAGINMADVLAEHSAENANKLSEMSEKLNEALARVSDLESELSRSHENNADAIYNAIVESFTKDMTIMQASKFETRASTLDVENFADAVNKLTELKTRIVESDETEEDEDECNDEECEDKHDKHDKSEKKENKHLDERLQRFL
jgi:hypothetical protein